MRNAHHQFQLHHSNNYRYYAVIREDTESCTNILKLKRNTTEEALEAALKELGVSRDQVSVKVIHEPTKGILGLGAKLAKIRVTLKEDISSTPEAVLHEILSHMGLEAEIESQIINGSVHLTVSSDNPGILIGKHGQTLNAVEYLLNCILNRSSLVKEKGLR